jgi:transposase
VQQAALRDLDRAFANFFAGRAKYPRFKRRTDREGSFVVRDLTVGRLNRKWGVVTVPKVGQVRFCISRLWAELAKATSARVTYRNGRWHISFTTPPSAKIEATTGAVVGIDRGVCNTLATSEGRMIQAPALTTGEEHRFLALQQQLTRQQKGSARRRVALDRLAVLRRRLEDRRTDWVETTTTELARTYDLIAVEELRVQNMVRRPKPKPDPDQFGVFLPNGARAKASLNKAILASCWGRFLGRLEHKTARRGSGPCGPQEHQSNLRRLWALRTRKPREPSGLRVRSLRTSGACRHQRSGRHPRPRDRHTGPGTRGVRAHKPSGPRWQRQPTGRVAAENPRTSARGGCQSRQTQCS